VMIQRFSGRDHNVPDTSFTPPVKQLSCPQSIEALIRYIALGASLTTPILVVMEKILNQGELTDIMLASFPGILASALEKRADLKLDHDDADSKLVNVAAKWLNLFITNAKLKGQFLIELWLIGGSDTQILAAARVIPFLLREWTSWPLIDRALQILADRNDDFTFRALIAINAELKNRLSIAADTAGNITRDHPDDSVITLVCLDGRIDVSKSAMAGCSPVFSAMTPFFRRVRVR